jgi:UDP:flavonoid glycosyltransferase YjiC (YdhE family)
MRSEFLDKQILINILETFKELPQYNFIWKFEADSLPIEKPENVKIAKFLPQNDLLAHAKLKAFITHSGQLSTQESLWHGKPMVGMPVFVDQHRVNDFITCVGYFQNGLKV